MREYLYATSPAVILAHAKRLASLVEGTPTYAPCVKLIARDLEDNAMMTPEDARRILASYTDPEKIAVMHVCGACGVRDPANTYCRTVRLSNLPADNGLRAKSAFVAHFGALGAAAARRTRRATRTRRGRCAVRSASRIRRRRLGNACCSPPPRTPTAGIALQYNAGALRLSVAAGDDFGNLYALIKLGVWDVPSTMEKLSLARARLHVITVKVIANGLTTCRRRLIGHAICFAHSRPTCCTRASGRLRSPRPSTTCACSSSTRRSRRRRPSCTAGSAWSMLARRCATAFTLATTSSGST
jgi:hypothetical protein